MINNEPIELTSGTQKRDIIRVEDITEIISRLIKSDYIKKYKLLPVGSGEQHTIKEILLFLKENLQSESELMFGSLPDRIGEPDTIADISWYKNIEYTLRWDYFAGLKAYSSREAHNENGLFSGEVN